MIVIEKRILAERTIENTIEIDIDIATAVPEIGREAEIAVAVVVATVGEETKQAIGERKEAIAILITHLTISITITITITITIIIIITMTMIIRIIRIGETHHIDIILSILYPNIYDIKRFRISMFIYLLTFISGCSNSLHFKIIHHTSVVDNI